ncbi:phage major capsid protein [Nitratireductor aquimarinus]|uniref:phage major capsid protein n=1 Tax=Nitratireductor aquimarinus TaxID=889300 RepID=UPI002935DE8D|nr:phage major capsid protein [Nitratireductor aquimarinus]MDV2964529.1 phage major capsid protein [Nitratireductor aquimarinus]
MAFTADELENITNATLDYYMGRGTVYANAIQNKPMMKAFDAFAKQELPGGKGNVSLAVKTGKGGGSLSGYTHDDTVTYYNPTGIKRVNFGWKEHHIGMGLTHTELKHDGITVLERGASQRTAEKDSREETMLANLLQDKVEVMNEDYAVSWDSLLHGDGTGDTKAIAGVQAFILDDPALGSTGGLARTNTWWRNRAATTAADTAGSGVAPITSNTAGGGALLQFLQTEERQLNRFAQGSRRSRMFAGSDFIDAVEKELRANGQYAQTGWKGGDGNVDGAMPVVRWNGITIEYDPTMDDLGLNKRMYNIDMRNLFLVYMKGEKMKKANPARPHDKYVMYRAVTTTAVMATRQLNTSGVYDIA